MSYNKEFWDKYADGNEARYNEEFAKFARDLATSLRCTSVLEIGCGTGIDLRLFPDTFQIHGIDLNDNALDIAKEKVPDANFKKGTITELPFEDVSRMYYSTIPEKITICEKNGGKVRLLVDMNDPKLVPFAKRFNATETRIGKLPSKGRMVVQEGKKMIMSDSAASSQNSHADSDFSLCTNSPEMIDNIFTLCSFLWDSLKPLKTLDVKDFVRKTNSIT